jgi:hypothetical protein
MNKSFLIFPISILLFSCHQKSFQEQIDDVRDEYSKQAEIQNKEVLSWEKIIDSINILADTNQILAIKRIDTLTKFLIPKNFQTFIFLKVTFIIM